MKRSLLLVMLLTVWFTACDKKQTGDKTPPGSAKVISWISTEPDDALLPGINPLNVQGNIVMAGSSTVYPLAERMAERFKAEGYRDNITIDSIGSGAGFERFCVTGETDIANASRPIKESEIISAEKIGRKPLEFRIGTDALAIVVSRENTFVRNLTQTELALVFGGVKRWSEINPDWPDKDILRFIPGTDSGTFDYFTEEIFHNDKKMILDAANLQLSEDDNILVQGVEGSPYAIGFFGYAYYIENQDKLRAVGVDGISPNNDTVDNNTYPLARPLFLYTSTDVIQLKPQIAAFIAFFLTYVDEEIRAVGYFPSHNEVMDAAKKNWLEAAKGLY